MKPLKGVTPELMKRWLDVFVESMIISGHLTKEDAKDDRLVLEKMESVLPGAGIQLVIDHRDRILQMAESHRKGGHEPWSALFYALYFEHTINNIIDAVLNRQKKSASVSKGLIRACKMPDKLTWVLDLLGLKAFDEKHQKVIERICEERNAFAHYKWTETDFNRSLAELLNSAHSSVTISKSTKPRPFSLSCRLSGKGGAIPRRNAPSSQARQLPNSCSSSIEKRGWREAVRGGDGSLPCRARRGLLSVGRPLPAQPQPRQRDRGRHAAEPQWIDRATRHCSKVRASGRVRARRRCCGRRADTKRGHTGD